MTAMRLPLLLLGLLCLGMLASAKPVGPSKFSAPPASCPGKTNDLPVTSFDLSTASPLRAVANGTLYQAFPHNSTTPLLIMHVYGDPYSQGVAYGSLVKSELLQMVPAAYAYFSEAYKVPRELVNELLDVTRNVTLPFTHAWHLEFLQGMSDGTGGELTYLDAWRVSLLPELIKASCSIAGAWGEATRDGDLIQLRALDWGTDGPFQRWPLLVTFHPDDDSFTYTNMGWVGMYGTLTGWSESGVVVSEKVWAGYEKLQNIAGYPWTYMLQDILRFDMDIDRALSRLAQSVRTCAIWLGFGQHARPNPHRPGHTVAADFRLVGDSFEQVDIWNPDNFPYYKNHDYFPDLLFVNKRQQPSSDSCMNELFHQSHGDLTLDDMYQAITALDKTGDMHIAVMDGASKTMLVSNAAPMPNNTPAYNNGFVRLDMKSLWSRPRKNVPATQQQEAKESKEGKLALE